MIARRLFGNRRMSFGKDQRGVAAIEAALVFPLLLMLVAGIMEYSRVLLAQHMIRDILDEAVRSGVVLDLTNLNIASMVAASVDEVPGLGEYDVDVARSPSALSITVSGDFQLFFGDLLPTNVVSFSLVSQYPI